MLLSSLLGIWLLLQRPAVGAIAVDKPQPHTDQKPFIAPFTPMTTPPSLPRVDLNSCPFEGCHFGKWTTNSKVIVYSSWELQRKTIAKLRSGEQVTAITGVNLTLKPGKGIFRRNSILYGAKKGDVAYLYGNCGEGAADMWTHGRFIKCADPNFSSKEGYGCQKNCEGEYVDLGKSEWWAQIRLKDGRTGWVLVSGNFDGIDSLG
jgi:hypothetical protein